MSTDHDDRSSGEPYPDVRDDPPDTPLEAAGVTCRLHPTDARLERLNRLGRIRTTGTVTGRLTLNEPQPQVIPNTEPPGLTPRAAERNVLPFMDLLERAADLLYYVLDCEVNRRPIGRAADFTHWTAKYERLAASDE